MKRCVRILTLVLALIMLCSTAMAKENLSLSIHNARMDDNGWLTATVYLVNEKIENTFLELRLDDQFIEWNTLNPIFDDPNEGTTWAFLVDTTSKSGIRPDGSNRHDTDFLKGFLNGNADGADSFISPDTDNLVLSTVKTSRDLKVKKSFALTAWVDTLREDYDANDGHQYNLTEALNNVLDFMVSSGEVHERKCLVLTAQHDRALDALSDANVKDKLSSGNITVYVYVTGSTPADKDVSSLEALVKGTIPGLVIINRENKDAKEAKNIKLVDGYLKEIKQNENRVYVVTSDTASQGKQGTQLKITLTENNTSVSQTYDMGGGAAPVVTDDPVIGDKTDDNDTTDNTNGETGSDDEKKEEDEEEDPAWLEWIKENKTIVIIAAGVLVAGLLLLLLLPKQKRADIYDPDGNEEDVVPPVAPIAPGAAPVTSPVTVSIGGTTPVGGDLNTPAAPTSYPATRPDGVRIQLRSASNPAVVHTAELIDSIVVGRAGNIALSVGESDTYISNLHLRLTYEEGNVYARNMGQNGTKVNGRTINDTVMLRPNDQIRIGHSDFVITWTTL